MNQYVRLAIEHGLEAIDKTAAQNSASGSANIVEFFTLDRLPKETVLFYDYTT